MYDLIPQISIIINHKTYQISKELWLDYHKNTCLIKLMHNPESIAWVLGLSFFTEYYIVFDYDNQSIGIANSINQGQKQSESFFKWLQHFSLQNLETTFFNETDKYRGASNLVIYLIGSGIALGLIAILITRKRGERQ